MITMQHHVCLETHGVTVDYRGGDTATVYASTQGTFTIPGDAAQRTGPAKRTMSPPSSSTWAADSAASSA